MVKPHIKFQTSWDDGHVLDNLIAGILLKHDLPGIFFIPTLCQLSIPEIKKLGKNFEIGGHTTTHPQDLKLLIDRSLHEEISVNKQILQDYLGRPVTKFCYPRGRFDERVIKEVKDCGYTYARTTKVLSTASLNPLITDPTIHIFPRREYHDLNWVNVAKLWAHKASLDGGVFHIWGHA